jgi:hypothetical protein
LDVPRKPKKPTQLDRIEADLAQVKGDVRTLVKRVDRVEGKASLWGGISAAVVALISHLAGCM